MNCCENVNDLTLLSFFLELGTKDMPTVTMRPSHLASNAPVVGNLISFSNSKLGDIP